jgi:hypothetical protein
MWEQTSTSTPSKELVTEDDLVVEAHGEDRDGVPTCTPEQQGSCPAEWLNGPGGYACPDTGGCLPAENGPFESSGCASQCYMGTSPPVKKSKQVVAEADPVAEAEPPPGAGPPSAEFYMYRATSLGGFDKARLGQVNTANLEGVMWYLLNEVVTMYSVGSRCPRKYGIAAIHRFKVTYAPTPELVKEGMHWGARFTFDNGSCMGRCFSDNLCTGEDDCAEHYGKYGMVPGCNNFRDGRPFPDLETHTPNGIWYSLPAGGRCAHPTGSHDCTWSYEDAGYITLEEVEKANPGQGNCCNGVCTNFWDDPLRNDWRANMARNFFAGKYPNMPRGLAQDVCDFNWDTWYTPDKWERRDPWKNPFWNQKHHSYLDH